MIVGLCKKLNKELLKTLFRRASIVRDFTGLNMPDVGFLQQIDFDFESFEKSAKEKGLDTSDEAMEPYVLLYHSKVGYEQVRESQCYKRCLEPHKKIRGWGF